jgi:hypothetical protein
MKIVHGDEVERKRTLEHRGGTFHSRRLLEGEPGTLGNFQFGLGQSGGDFYSPRHRHNFEQFRFQIAGTLDFARNGKMKPGMVGYFPEGVYYGPQSQQSDEQPLTAVLQFGGASGGGYLAEAEVKAGMAELRKHGEFKDGVFRRTDGAPGKKNLDGYQAIWEAANGKPMTYPKGRYDTPVFMDSTSYDWVPVEGQRGVSAKLLGIFTERRSTAELVKLDQGAQYLAKGRGVYLVVTGAGTIGDQKYRSLTAIYLTDGETLCFAAGATTEMLHLGLPNLASLEAGKREQLTAEAAE